MAQHTDPHASVTAVMPAWNEADSITRVIEGLQQAGIDSIVVGDNASTDATAQVAAAAGATVVPVPQRGYGSACQGALAALPPGCRAVLFCDADGADDLKRIPALVAPVLRGEIDLHVGSRARGRCQRGALSFPQRVGNVVCATLMRWLYGQRVSDLGPFRCIDRTALERLHMSDPDFGWTAEMQVKAFRLGLRYAELPVDAKCRIAGTSKISGKLLVGLQAGWIIIRTILRHHRRPLEPDACSAPSAS